IIFYYVRSKPKMRDALVLAVKVGNCCEDDDRGVAHIVEHPAFSTTKKYTNHDIVKLLEIVGAEFGECQNATTSADETIYELLVPVDKPELLSQAISVLAEFSSEVRVSAEDMEKERGDVLEEYRGTRNANGRMQDAHWNVMMEGSKALFTGKIAEVSTRIVAYMRSFSVGGKRYTLQAKTDSAGASGYSRFYDYARIRQVCDKQKAILLADAHISYLVAAGAIIPSPFEYAAVKGSQQTSKEVMHEYEDKITQLKEVHTIIIRLSFLGFKEVHTITGLAVALKQATTTEYKAYEEQVLRNCSQFAKTLNALGYDIVSAGTEYLGHSEKQG
ncbi:hypothetical protein C5167_026296, partial [Papaver somniferum]